jgi:hypothetical protein
MKIVRDYPIVDERCKISDDQFKITLSDLLDCKISNSQPDQAFDQEEHETPETKLFQP